MGKKQRRKKRARPDSVDPNELRRQRLEARRQAKAEADAARAKRRRRETFIRFLSVAVLASLVFWFLFLRDRAPTEINGNAIETMSVRGLNLHTRETVSYESAPPVSGAHAPGPAACGIHAQPIQDELQVHMVEHGAVGVQYRPDAFDLETIRQIEELVGGYDSFTFSAPYLEMETPIAVSSWARLMRLDTFDEDAVRQYIEEFRDKGPEANRPCPNDAEQPFEFPEEAEGEEGGEGAPPEEPEGDAPEGEEAETSP
jgi:hypothetical protein